MIFKVQKFSRFKGFLKQFSINHNASIFFINLHLFD